MLQEYLNNFKDLNHSEIANKLIESGEGWSVAENIDKFKGLDKSFGRVFVKNLLGSEDIRNALRVNEHFGNVNVDLKRAVDIFGSFVNLESYNLVLHLKNNELSREEQENVDVLGIQSTGVEALQELRAKLQDFVSRVLSTEGPNAQEVLNSKILKDYLKNVTQFNVSEWGSHEEDSFNNILKTFNSLTPEQRKLNEAYVPSEYIDVKKLDRSKDAEIKPSEQSVGRYEYFKENLQKALSLLENDEALMPIIESIKEKTTRLKQELESKKTSLENERAKANIQKTLDKLSSIDINESIDWQEMFSLLSSFKKEFRDELVTTIFWWSLKLNPDKVQETQEQTQKEDVSMKDISWMLNFVDHTTNQETLKQYFSDSKSAKDFNNLLSVRALQEELARIQNQKTKGEQTMQFVPGRNLLTELSGHIADACWASKYDSIVKQFPNFTSLSMVLNPDNQKTRRLVGSAFLIEAKSKTSEDLLIIRGLNPVENVINTLQTEDYFNKITDYLKDIATSMNRKLAIVIDDHSGGSSTNRPVLFEYLKNKSKSMKKVPLASDKDTNFNGYNIVNEVYLVE